MSQYNPFSHHPPLECYPNEAGVQKTAILEIGPGRGDFLFELARQHPDKQIAAIEIKRKRYFKLIKRIERQELYNISLILGDARVALPQLFGAKQLERIYILFLDPWPKKRHAKHRLFQDYFADSLHRCLKPDGEVVLAHDNADYLAESRETLMDHEGLLSEEISRELPFETFYAQKWREAGRDLYSCRVRKKIT